MPSGKKAKGGGSRAALVLVPTGPVHHHAPPVSVHGVPYSEYPELEHFVSALPQCGLQQIVPTVNVASLRDPSPQALVSPAPPTCWCAASTDAGCSRYCHKFRFRATSKSAVAQVGRGSGEEREHCRIAMPGAHSSMHTSCSRFKLAFLFPSFHRENVQKLITVC
jgi:hypothetical protein